MSGKEGEDIRGPWPQGMNNRLRDAQLSPKALRNAVNVNIASDGTPARRDGFDQLVDAEYHSLWGEGLDWGLVVKGNTLTLLTASSAGTVTETSLRTGLTVGRRMAYVLVNGAVHYSNGVVTGRVVDGADVPWGVEHAAPPAAAALAYGGMAAGRYQVAITYVFASGEEGGTSRAVAVNVAAGGGIQLSSIPQPTSAFVTGVRVYITPANGERFYEYGQLATGVTSVALAASTTLGAELTTWGLYPPPPADVLELHLGSIAMARGPYLWFTEPLHYGQYRPETVYVLRDDISIVASLSRSSLAVAADIHYVMSGSDVRALALDESYECKAVRGTLFKTPDGGRGWLTQGRGMMFSNGTGGFAPHIDDAVYLEEATEGAAMFREIEGQQFMVATLHDGAASTAVVEDFFDAEVIRRS